MNKLVLKVLRKHLSLMQIFGFFFANLLGLSILFASLTFYLDTKDLFEEKVEESSKTTLVINKKVNSLNTFGFGKNNFSEREINKLREQRNIEEVGLFSSAHYSVTASFQSGISLYTYIFLESVEDKFLDIKPKDWGFVEGQEYIPIILPRSYLTLYNTAFAVTQGLPTFGDNTIKSIRLKLDLEAKNGLAQTFEGRIVGFSDKLNTILVPQSFINWSNSYFAPNHQAEPSRLILKVKDPSNTALLAHIKEQGYEVQDNQLHSAQAKFIFQIITFFVFGLGAIISLLALYLLVLSTLLLIEKSNKEYEDLLLLGYARRLLNRPFYLISSGTTFLSGLIAIGLTYLIQSYYLGYVQRIYPEISAKLPSYGYLLALAFGFSLLALLITFINLYRRMPRLPKKK